MLNDIEYKQNFYNIITMGWCCGCMHPIEALCNAYRTPGGTLPEEYYEKIRKIIPRFLFELFELSNQMEPENSNEILKMCDSYYKNNSMMIGFFDFMKDEIQEYIEAFSATL